MDQNAKQLAVEKLKDSTNVLVTVGNNPQVDDLSALIGFSLLLGKLGKHASAVFSGRVPPAINFLQPDRRLEKDVSSLRDFIIALDKDKADKLRYKVEDNVVKIFITPYKSRISQNDLSFSEGDFNVDTVVALGVSKRDDLDNAIKAHGRILHDAAVVTVNAGANSSDLGAIDWQDPAASSLCEMLVSISESFGSGLLDEQISTAFLTGIVAATSRFSNNKTSPKVMTMAAQLMAAGANQQLISNNLQLGPTAPQAPAEQADDSQLSIDHGDPKSPSVNEVELPAPRSALGEQATQPDDQTYNSAQTETKPAQPPANPQSAHITPNQEAPQDKSIKELEDQIAQMASSAKSKKKELLPDNQPKNPPKGTGTPGKPGADSGLIGQSKGHGPRDVDDDPLMGGTFNATSEQAHEESLSDIKKNVNSTLLSHPGKPLVEEDEPEEDRPESRAPDVQPLTMDKTPSGEIERAGKSEEKPSEKILPPDQDDSGVSELNVEDARKAVEEAVGPSNNSNQPINTLPVSQGKTGDNQEISIDSSGNLQQPSSPASPPSGDTNQEFKLPS